MERQTVGRIVVGYDGSEPAGAAVEWAAAEAARRDADLTVLHATDFSGLAPGPVGASAWAPDLAAEAARKVAEEGAARAAASAKDVQVAPSAMMGHAAKTLVDASREADLVVLGTRGHGPLAGAFLGSVSFAVTAHSDSPVVVVHGEPGRAAGPDTPVIVGVDDSPAAWAALRFAADHAAATGAPLRIVTTWQPLSGGDPWVLGYYETASHGDESEARRDEVQHVLQVEAERVRAAAVEQVRQEHPELAVSSEAVSGDPRTVLADASADAGLLAVGARGHGGFAGLLLGSVSHGLIHSARCPVAVVRQ